MTGLIASLNRRSAFPLVMLVMATSNARAGEAEIRKLREQYPPAVARLAAAYSNVAATGELKRARPGAEPGRTAIAEIRASDGMQKAVLSWSRSTPEGQAAPADRRYCICIGRETMFDANASSASGGKWLLSDAGRTPAPGAARGGSDIETRFSEMAGKYLYSTFLMNGWSGLDVLDDSRFKITNAEEFHDDGGRILRFRYTSHGGGGGSLQSGMIELLPDRAWAVRHHEHSGAARLTGRRGAGQPFKLAVDVDYAERTEGPPVPRKVRYSGSGGESEFVFDKVEFGVVTPEREFTPAYYGLPDVAAPPPDPAHGVLAYWLFGLAACATVAAVLTRRR